MLMTLAQAQALIAGSRLVGPAGVELLRVHSDTRTLRAGDLYVALKGERFDGHDFLAQARASGAVAALACHGLGEDLPGLLVDDGLAASDQPVDERRLADVRIADDGDGARDRPNAIFVALGNVATALLTGSRRLATTVALQVVRHDGASTRSRDRGGTASRGNPACSAAARKSRRTRSSSSRAANSGSWR